MFTIFRSKSPEEVQQEALRKLDLEKTKKLFHKTNDFNVPFTDKKLYPLHFAVACGGKTALLEYLLNQPQIDIDCVDAAGETPLMHAAKRGETNACCLLIKHGADYSLKSPIRGQDSLALFESSSYKFLASKLKSAIQERSSFNKNSTAIIESDREFSFNITTYSNTDVQPLNSPNTTKLKAH